jgi:hypothetical protein
MSGMADDPFKKSLAQRQAEASQGYASYRAGEEAARANMLRLRAERLAREAADPPLEAEPAEVKPRRPRKRIVRR